MILGYTVDGVEYECYINLRQTKYRLVFYQSKSGRPNPHALIKVSVGSEISVFGNFDIVQMHFQESDRNFDHVQAHIFSLFVVSFKLNDLVPN